MLLSIWRAICATLCPLTMSSSLTDCCACFAQHAGKV